MNTPPLRLYFISGSSEDWKPLRAFVWATNKREAIKIWSLEFFGDIREGHVECAFEAPSKETPVVQIVQEENP